MAHMSQSNNSYLWKRIKILVIFIYDFMKKHSLLVWRQYIYLLASNPRTIVMLWSTESHITFCLLYNLIHLTSIGDAAALLWSNGHCHMILRGGDGSEETILCTVGAYSWPGDDWSTILCGGKGVFAQPPFLFWYFFLKLNQELSLFKRSVLIETAFPRTGYLSII